MIAGEQVDERDVAHIDQWAKQMIAEPAEAVDHDRWLGVIKQLERHGAGTGQTALRGFDQLLRSADKDIGRYGTGGDELTGDRCLMIATTGDWQAHGGALAANLRRGLAEPRRVGL